MLAPEPGETIDGLMRERWFGATGRRVPEIAVEGEPAVPVDEALVLDDVDDEAGCARRTTRARRSSCARRRPTACVAALARPEVASRARPAGRASCSSST